MVRGYIGGRGAVVLDAVYIPANLVRLPFYGKSVEIIGDRVAEIVDAPKAAAPLIAWAVDGAVDLVWHAADVLHVVNLARLWPVNPVDVCAQTPEGWP